MLEPDPEPPSKPRISLGLFQNIFVPGLRTSCGPNWYTGGSSNNSYILSLFVTCFVMPLGLILFSYANLLMTLRAVSTASTGEGMVFRSQNTGEAFHSRDEAVSATADGADISGRQGMAVLWGAAEQASLQTPGRLRRSSKTRTQHSRRSGR